MLAIAITQLFAIVMTLIQASAATKAEALEVTIMDLDATLFEQGFNQCSLEPLDRIVHAELVFLHDQSGVTRSRASFLQSLENNICDNPDSPKRVHIPHSETIYPLYKQGELYGAIQSGEHRFYLRDGQGGWRASSDARFTHVWQIDNGQWQLTQVLSFDHREPDPGRLVPKPPSANRVQGRITPGRGASGER